MSGLYTDVGVCFSFKDTGKAFAFDFPQILHGNPLAVCEQYTLGIGINLPDTAGNVHIASAGFVCIGNCFSHGIVTAHHDLEAAVCPQKHFNGAINVSRIRRRHGFGE